MLIVGDNTYIDIASADEIVKARLDKNNGLRVFWEVLDDEEKETYLLRAVEEMELIPFIGRKHRHTQNLAFPRAPFEDVPYEIKLAQAYNALGHLNEEIKETAEETAKLFRKYGAMGEIDNENGAISNDTHTPRHIVLASKKATKIAQKYARGAFRMR
jgi:hypothetical protein